MRHTLATSVRNKTKVGLAQMLLLYVLEEPETSYRRLLTDFTKKEMDAVLPSRTARRADAVDGIIFLDRRTFSRPVDRDPPISMQLVHVEPLNTNLVLMQDVAGQRKHIKKTWARLARRKLRSQKMITVLKSLISSADADRMTIYDLRVEVCKRIGMEFHATVKPNMLVFFHKQVQRLLHKKAQQHRRPVRKRQRPLVFVADVDAVKAWGETQRMWAEDHWHLKFAMLDASCGTTDRQRPTPARGKRADGQRAGR